MAIVALAVLTAGLLPANYHFVHYATSTPPYAPIFERFQLESMPGGVVPFLIVDPPSSLQLNSGDTFAAVVSQLRAAANVWNTVPTSTLRLQFGGMATPNVTMTTPAVVISFDELPPGVIAMAGPVTKAQITTGANGQQLVPILQSSMVIGPDLRAPSVSSTGIGPSWSDRLFMTLVHEFGHTLGLQHTWTSSAMSTEITRATGKAHPLGADDVAGISMLYPTPDWAATYGSIKGQVTMGGLGVAMASVVALTPGGEAVSTLTNPDGSYEIDGLVAGSYQVYVHPVPPSLPGESYSGDLTPPLGPQGAIQVTPPFNTAFAGSSTQVTAGAATPGIDFIVTPRASTNIYGVQTYAFVWDTAAQAYDTTKPATFLLGSTGDTAVVTGDGLFAANNLSPASGLSASVLGAPDMIQSLSAYPYGAGYLQFQISTASQTAAGPRHVILRQGGETEVVPSAILLADAAPPAVTAVQQNGDGTVNVAGSGIGPGTRVLFNGAVAAVQAAGSGQVTVVPPPALPGANASVIVTNPDGQDSSFFSPAAAPPVYSYGAGQQPSIQLSPASAPAGSKVIVDITGSNVDFATGNLQIGFGSSDIFVQQVWVISPQRAIAQLSVSSAAQQGSATVTLSAGLQFLELPGGFQVTAPPLTKRQPRVFLYTTGIQPGGVFVFSVDRTSPWASPVDFTVTVSGSAGDERAFIFFYMPGPLFFAFAPPDLPLGPALLKVTYLDAALDPVVAYIGGQPTPNIVQATSAATGVANSAASPAFPGDMLVLTVPGLADSIAPMDLAAITVAVGGIAQSVTQVRQDNTTNTATVNFVLSPQTQVAALGTLPLTIAFDGRVSPAFALSVAPH